MQGRKVEKRKAEGCRGKGGNSPSTTRGGGCLEERGRGQGSTSCGEGGQCFVRREEEGKGNEPRPRLCRFPVVLLLDLQKFVNTAGGRDESASSETGEDGIEDVPLENGHDWSDRRVRRWRRRGERSRSSRRSASITNCPRRAVQLERYANPASRQSEPWLCVVFLGIEIPFGSCQDFVNPTLVLPVTGYLATAGHRRTTIVFRASQSEKQWREGQATRGKAWERLLTSAEAAHKRSNSVSGDQERWEKLTGRGETHREASSIDSSSTTNREKTQSAARILSQSRSSPRRPKPSTALTAESYEPATPAKTDGTPRSRIGSMKETSGTLVRVLLPPVRRNFVPRRDPSVVVLRDVLHESGEGSDAAGATDDPIDGSKLVGAQDVEEKKVGAAKERGEGRREWEREERRGGDKERRKSQRRKGETNLEWRAMVIILGRPLRPS